MLRINWFFGPDKEAFVLGQDGVARAHHCRPFHGIVSRGMLARMQQLRVAPEVWNRHAHLLLCPESPLDSSSPQRDLLHELMAQTGALSFGESASCVRSYLERYLVPSLAALPGEPSVDVWYLKEGHTSSVWKVSVPRRGSGVDEFIVNVARDHDAGVELTVTSERMRALGARCPGINMAAVLDISSVRLVRRRASFDVVVTANEWIADSLEIHLQTDRAGTRRYLLVERFLTESDSPATVTSVRGRRCSVRECRLIEEDAARFRAAASTVLTPAPQFDINHGDLVWTGRGAVVVAIS